MTAARVYVGIGSNLERKKNLRRAVARLCSEFGELDLSPVYRNAAVGFDGPDFFNLVAGFDSERTPAELATLFESIHADAGRRRDGPGNQSRTLDIDLLLYGDVVTDDPPLPRPDVLEYDFVLRPLVDIVPNLRHPVSGRRLAEHWAELGGGHRLERIEVSLVD